MRIRYRLAVAGNLCLAWSFPIQTQHFTYSFETDADGMVTHLTASAPANDPSQWPRIGPSNQSGAKFHIQNSSPLFDDLRREIRVMEGFLSMCGVDEINLDEVEVVWEPESEGERRALDVYSFKVHRARVPASELNAMPFDFVARLVLASTTGSHYDAALNFFRKGKVDVRAEQYLDAVLDFLFMIETTYANGKFHKAAVEQEYLASTELCRLLAETEANPVLRDDIRSDPRFGPRFAETYAGKTPGELIPHLVSLRGELHHHSGRKRGIWHPTEHIRFAADALFLEYLCHAIAFAITNDAVFHASNIQAYRQQVMERERDGLIVRHRPA